MLAQLVLPGHKARLEQSVLLELRDQAERRALVSQVLPALAQLAQRGQLV